MPGWSNSKENQQGFTLVELAISIAVIGLLLGAVLKGEELIGNARAAQTVKQVQNYRAAMRSFQTIYGALPGDMYAPGTRLPNCTGNCATNGNSDRVIGTDNTGTVFSGTFNIANATEQANFFLHLSAAGLITVAPTKLSSGYEAKAPGDSVFFVGYTSGPASATQEVFVGHFIFLASPASGTTTKPDANVTITPRLAKAIDQKSDDGLPFSGDTRTTIPASNCVASSAYITTYNGDGCSMAFKLGA